MPKKNQISTGNGVQVPYPANELQEWGSMQNNRSGEVTEIIGKMPPWILRRGIMLIGLLFLGIFIAAWFFKYPDVIVSKMVISYNNPPVRLVARSGLPIRRIFVCDNEQVHTDEILCILSNSVNYDDVQRIIPLTRQLDTTLDLRGTTQKIKIPAGLQLGELQAAYTGICQSIQNYLFFIAHNAYGVKIGSLAKQVRDNGQLQKELSGKERMLQEQLKLQHNQFAADSSLVKDKVISPLEYDESKKKMLDQQMNTGNNRTSMIQNDLQKTGYQKDIAELTLQKQSEENDLQQKIRDAIRQFVGQYAQWEQSYVIKSPIEGRITLFKYWKENQVVTTGEGVMMVTPPVDEYVVHGLIGVENNGKIKIGQKVMIKLPAYPFEEYGMLNGQIASRSMVAMDGNYSLEIKLENGLITNTGKIIPQQPELDAVGDILTGNKTILSRLFERIIGKLNTQGE